MNDIEKLIFLVKQLTEASKEKSEANDIVIAGLRQEMLDVQQKMAAGEHSGGGSRTSDSVSYELAKMLGESDVLKSMKSGHTRGIRLDLPENFMIKAPITSGLGITAPDYQPGIVGIARRRPTVRSLMQTIRTTSGSINYVRQATRTINAAPVSEGATKPITPMDLDMQTAQVVTLAHLAHASNQLISDVPQLQFFIEAELRYGLEYVEDAQLLMGSGVGINLNGLYTQATAALDVSGDMPSDLRKAIAQLAVANFQADGIVIHPNDWAKIELMRAATDGPYLVGVPRGVNPQILWNCSVVTTTAMSEGSFLCGAFAQCGFIADRQDVTVDLATMDSDDFQKNLIKIRVEERLALVVTAPSALIKGVLA